ncbi:MAG: glycoside hydrolase family 15 protein [Bellilinea sp.]
MGSLYSNSLRIIKEGQSESGAYIASPNFPTYHYCWLRDGSFIAHAMDTAGEFGSSEAFFRWVGRTIQKYGAKVENVRNHLEAGRPVGKDDVLHTRYTLDGSEVTVDNGWGNFQIDGYGTWLWALAEHMRLSGNTHLLKELCEPIQITLRYLELVWKLPNYDCWEEYPEYLHPYSLATAYAGFDSIASLVRTGQMDAGSVAAEELAGQVKDFMLKYAVYQGRVVKHVWPARARELPGPISQSGVDASLIGVAVPYNVLPLDDPLIRATMQAIEASLHRPEGGVYRYKADVYYGGGEWLLLTAWLGWYYALTGKIEQAETLRTWIETQADGDGRLAEQVSGHTLAPEHFEPWQKKWGPVASPLLWSHAMYIILVNAIQDHRSQ